MHTGASRRGVASQPHITYTHVVIAHSYVSELGCTLADCARQRAQQSSAQHLPALLTRMEQMYARTLNATKFMRTRLRVAQGIASPASTGCFFILS